jgi:alpha-amylase
MGVLLQAFYWDCPEKSGCEFKWWDHVKANIGKLANAGFTAIWLPPPGKGSTQRSMGYEPFDHFDLGEFDQRGGIPTWFGTRKSLEELLFQAHKSNMQVYVDLAINRAGGGAPELNDYSGQTGFTHFDPASKRFPKNWECFHPSHYEYWEGAKMGGAETPTFCHKNPFVYEQIMEYSRFLVEDIGFDGFCFDLGDGYGTWMAKVILGQRYKRGENFIRPYGMAHALGSSYNSGFWLNEFNKQSENPLAVFDVPLRFRLKSLCDVYGTNIPSLLGSGTLFHEDAFSSITFVDNHKFRDEAHPPIFNDKMLAYAFILTHTGYPCVFWEDYFGHNLALQGQVSGIHALVKCQGQYAKGPMVTHHIGSDLYVMERLGIDDKPGLILVMNNRGDRWQGVWVHTSKPSTRFIPVAWRGKDDLNPPAETWTHNEGHGNFWAPPRGYTVYIPQ